MILFARSAFAAALILLLSTAADAASVTGTVTSAADGKPQSGMVVAAYDASGLLRGTATTDATGLYVLTLEPGNYRFLAYDPAGLFATMFDGNAESFETTPIRSISATGATLSFALVRGGSLMGTVRTAGGAPVVAAVVEVYNLSGTRRGFTTATATGQFSLVVPPGDYKVVAFDGIGPYAHQFFPGARSFTEAGVVQVAAAQTRVLDFTLGLAAQVGGITLDRMNRAPLAGMLVYAYSADGMLVATRKTDPSGQFRFALPAGDYRFVAADPEGNYATAFYQRSTSFQKARIVTAAAGVTRTDLELEMSAGVEIRGRVNGGDFLVAAYNLDGTLHASTVSNASGDYTLLVEPGEYRIAVSDPSGAHATSFYGSVTDFRFAPVLYAHVDLTEINVSLEPAGRVSGTARSVDGEPVAGAVVAAYDALGHLGGSAPTDAQGNYLLVVATGSWRMLAYDPQLVYATSHAHGAVSFETTPPITILAGQTSTLDFTLRPGVRVSGTVITETGQPVSDVDVFALDATGNRVAGGTSAEGAFTIVVLPGTYRLITFDPMRRYAPSAVTPPFQVIDGQLPSPLTVTVGSTSRRRSSRH